MQLGNPQKRLEIFTLLGGSQLLSGLTDAVRIGIASLNLFGGNLKFLEMMLTDHHGDRTRRSRTHWIRTRPIRRRFCRASKVCSEHPGSFPYRQKAEMGHCVSPGWAAKDQWCAQVMRSRLEPMNKVAKTIRAHKQLMFKWFEAKNVSPLKVQQFLFHRQNN